MEVSSAHMLWAPECRRYRYFYTQEVELPPVPVFPEWFSFFISWGNGDGANTCKPPARKKNGYGRSTGANFPLRGLCLAQISVKYEWIITMKIYAKTKTKTKKHQGVISKKYKNMQPSQLLCSQHQGCVCVRVCASSHPKSSRVQSNSNQIAKRMFF